MPPASAAKPTARKRVRKRKRRAVSSSSESSSSDSSSSEDDSPPKIVKIAPKPVEQSSESESDSDSSDSSSSNSSSTSVKQPNDPYTTTPMPTTKLPQINRSPSSSPPPPEIPSFLPEKHDTNSEQKEQELKEKFRKFWMASVADGFRDDLEQLRKEPNLSTSRLTLLIDSLASGAEVFSSTADGGVTEMDVVLD